MKERSPHHHQPSWWALIVEFTLDGSQESQISRQIESKICITCWKRENIYSEHISEENTVFENLYRGDHGQILDFEYILKKTNHKRTDYGSQTVSNSINHLPTSSIKYFWIQ